MELTIDQALQQGVTAHKDGKLQDAERFYRAILQTNPHHPDANHNLGILAASLNKVEASLPFFEAAIEANPNIEQFWLSYIEALIQTEQIDIAKKAIREAEMRVLSEENLSFLTMKLTSPANTQRTPSPKEGDRLFEYFHNGQYKDAERLARTLIEQYPKYLFAWKVLGVLLQRSYRMKESLEAVKKSVQLAPYDPEAHYNLGVVFKELGRCGEAAASYQNAIKVNPSYAKAYSNLGDAFKELSRLEEAEASYRKAVSIMPKISELYDNLGVALEKLGRWEEAAANYMKAINLNPDFAEAHNNLGNILQTAGKMEEAKASYAKAIYLKPGFSEAHFNLSTNLSYMGALDKEICSWKNLIQSNLDKYRLIAGVNLAICFFLKGDFFQSRHYLTEAEEFQDIELLELQNTIVYKRYLLKVLNWHKHKYFKHSIHKNDAKLYVIGESHSLVAHQLTVKTSTCDLLCVAKLIKGCMQWHLGSSGRNQYKHKVEYIFGSLPRSSHVLLTIGEIDCRFDSGIIKHKKKVPSKTIEEIIITTVESYLTYILEINSYCQHNIIFQGVPCPNIEMESYSEKEIEQLNTVIKIMNLQLETKSQEKGFQFLDVYKLTDRGDGFSNSIWHIDDIHLSPDGFLEAWSQCFT
jgi:tetratricopeptide (TPR) repeat protein